MYFSKTQISGHDSENHHLQDRGCVHEQKFCFPKTIKGFSGGYFFPLPVNNGLMSLTGNRDTEEAALRGWYYKKILNYKTN